MTLVHVFLHLHLLLPFYLHHSLSPFPTHNHTYTCQLSMYSCTFTCSCLSTCITLALLLSLTLASHICPCILAPLLALAPSFPFHLLHLYSLYSFLPFNFCNLYLSMHYFTFTCTCAFTCSSINPCPNCTLSILCICQATASLFLRPLSPLLHHLSKLLYSSTSLLQSSLFSCLTLLLQLS